MPHNVLKGGGGGGGKKIFDLGKFWVKNLSARNVFGSKMNVFQKLLGPKLLGQKNV